MPAIQVGELENDVKSGSFRSVYVLVGPEAFLRRLAVNSLRKSVVPRDAVSFNCSEFSAKDSSMAEIVSAACTFPFGCPRRLVIVHDLEAMDGQSQAEMIGYIDAPSLKTVLVLVAEDLDRRFGFFKSLREKAAMIEFPQLKGTQIERWAEQYIRGQGFRISTSAVRKLAALAGSDLQTLAGEIEKLLLYAGREKTIPESAIEELVAVSKHNSVFELTNAIGKHDRPGALRLLTNLLDSDESPIGITVMIARHFRQILIAKEMLEAGRKPHEIGVSAQVPSFVLDDFLRQARGFDWNTARTMYLRLAEADLRFRSSSVDQRLILEDLICRS